MGVFFSGGVSLGSEPFGVFRWHKRHPDHGSCLVFLWVGLVAMGILCSQEGLNKILSKDTGGS